jgi:hypothetical protein
MTTASGTVATPVEARPRSRARRMAGPLIAAGGLLAATAYVGAVDPNAPGHYPLCPTKYLTGLDCPGCGGLRAVHSLAHGDVAGALNHNAFVVLLVIPLILGGLVAWAVREWRGEPAKPVGERWYEKRWLLVTLGVVMIAFTVVRNIPGVPAFGWLGSGV